MAQDGLQPRGMPILEVLAGDTQVAIENNLPAAGPLGSDGGGLIWGIDFADNGPFEISNADSPRQGNFRWLHFNLAHNAARQWLEHVAFLPVTVREVLRAQDSHQRAFVDDGVMCCVLHDLQRDFDARHVDRVGALRVALTDDMIITARLYPLGSGDILRRRFGDRSRVDGPARALDLLVGAISDNVAGFVAELSNEVQKAEDAYLAGHPAPTGRQLLEIRRRLSQLHGILDGMQRVFFRLEDDDDLPPVLHPTVEKLAQRLQGLDEDALGVQGQLRVLRDEVELQATQKLNQNIYILSVVTALFMLATLVTGLFGMNTGSLPFMGAGGSYVAMAIAGASSLVVFLMLRSKGFFGGG